MSARAKRAGIVDVLIAAWNRADTIEHAVASALAEPEVANVIVVDDGSSDDTVGRVRHIARHDDRTIIHRLSTNSGPSTARNAGLTLSAAPWVAVLDGDDFFLPGRIAKLLASAGGCDLVGDDILQIDEAQVGKSEPRPSFGDRSATWRLDFETFVRGNASRRGAPRRELGFVKPLMRRAFLDRHGLRYDPRLRLGEDYALYARALGVGARFAMLPPCGYVSVMRAGSLSGRHAREDLERLRDVDLELAAIDNLTRADQRALRVHYHSVDAKIRWLAIIDGFKARSPSGFLKPFVCSPEVSGSLVQQLFDEGFRRLPFGVRKPDPARLDPGGV
jgi:succinoglycan biosynthesis protein ExoU